MKAPTLIFLVEIGVGFHDFSKTNFRVCWPKMSTFEEKKWFGSFALALGLQNVRKILTI